MSEPVAWRWKRTPDDKWSWHLSNEKPNTPWVKAIIEPLCVAPLQQETDKDGERYRWLRRGHGYKLASQDFWGQSDSEIDAAIDAAIAALPQKDGMK